MEKAITVGIYAITACIVGSFIESAITNIAKMNVEAEKNKAYEEGFDAGKAFQQMMDRVVSFNQ